MNLLKFWKSYFLDQFTLHLGGGGGGGQTTSTVQNTNVPEYARPYVETMLGATQEQLFQGSRGPDVTNPETGEVTRGDFNITGFKPYQAYGGTYDPVTGKQLSYDPSKGIADINAMQANAYNNVGAMQVPRTEFADANSMAKQAGLGGLRSAQDAMRFGNAGFESGQKGQQLGIAGGQLGITGGAKYGEMGAGYGAQGAGYGSQAAGLADTALGYGQSASDIGRMGLRAETYGRQVSGQAEDYARQQAGAGAQYAQMATDPRVTQALMNPYTQNVLDVQNKELDRSAGAAAQARGAQAVRAGAFGGGRQAVENAEAERNLAMLKNANQAQALNQAYQQAQAQQQFGANLNLQGLAGAQQGLGTALQGGQLGLSGIGTALQGQQGALAGVGAANQAYQTGIQGSQAGIAGAGMGLQGVNTQLAGVDRQLAGTAQGMQGAQVGLQGVSGAQAGYGLANQSASNLTSMLGQQQQQELGLYNTQMAMGDKKMAYDQSIKNQAVQDYANAQQYPLMQLGTMSNMLRGLPMQASTTNQYAAAPSAASQAIGTIGAGASIYNAMKPPGNAAGGEVKGYAKGGIMSYDMGGEVEDQLENMDEKGLAAQAKESSSPSIRRMAQRILRERQMGNKPQGTGPMGVQYQAAQPQMPSYAPGGIVAFATGGGAKSAIEEGGEEDAKLGMAERLAMPPSTTPPPGGIMGATTQPITPIPAAPQTNRALQQSPDIPAFMKAEYAEAERRKNAPLSEFMAERQAAMREAGVADISEGQQKQRAELMAEKANMADEKERQRHLRLAEFFASWGSTPGPTLVAGMNALKQSVPGIISDEKEQKKARREIDKSIADLDNATRLEKRGEVDAAMALKLKAAEDMKALNTKFIDYQSRRESDASSAAASKYSADMQFRGEQLRAQTARLDRTARLDTEKDNKIFGQWQAASKTEADVLGRIQREENDKQHMADLNAVKLGKQTGMDEDNKFDETKVPPAVLSAMKEAQARIEAREKGWKQRIKTAAENTDIAYNRIAIRPEVAARDYTRPTGEPQAGASTRPALTDPSLQRQ